MRGGTAICLVLLCLAAPSPAQTGLGPELVRRAAMGEALPPPEDPTELALRFLEWHYLSRWVEADLAGAPTAEASARWARSREHRLGDEGPAPRWALQRRKRGLCIYEESAPGDSMLAVYGASLGSGRFEATLLLVEGILQGRLLQSAGLPGCGEREDPALALAASLGEIPEFSLEELKSRARFAQLYFAAEREVERWRLWSLNRVQAFLDRPGFLFTIRYGFRPILELSSPEEPEQTDAEHWIYPAGLTADWGDDRRLELRDLPVLHMPAQNMLQFIDPEPELSLSKDGEAIAAPPGEFELKGRYRLSTAHMDLDLKGGRWRRDDEELRLWWPGNFLEANRNGFLFALLILVVTVYLTVMTQRKKRELARDTGPKRPRRP